MPKEADVKERRFSLEEVAEPCRDGVAARLDQATWSPEKKGWTVEVPSLG